MSKQHNQLRILCSAVAIALMSSGIPWTSASAQTTDRVSMSDDIGADGLERRGDGSIDDDQPGGAAESGEDRVELEHSDVRTRTLDGTRTRDRKRVTVHGVTGERRERTRSEVRNPDGSRVRIRTETRVAADGTVLRERTRVRDREAHGDRAERPDRAERGERAERPERAERAERPERAERAERPERAERSGS